LIPSARAAVASLDRTIALGEGLRPFDDLAADSVGLRRASMTLVTLFAVFALTLAVVGAYSLVAYVVAQRTREFGIRLALGARHTQVYGAALRYGLVPVLIGIVAGVAGALAGSRVLQSLLFEVTPYDPVTFAFVSLMFIVVGSLAMFVPAHRAAMLDPVAALRHD
jgi:ABC-type antimicrobial peptide transport system permease subunit